MESFVKTESKTVGKKKRKLQNEEYSESSSSGVQVEESKTAQLQHKESSAKKRASSLRSSSSAEWFFTSDENDENTDESSSEGGLTDEKEGTFPANIPDFENSVKKFSRLTKESLLFSWDFDEIKKRINDCFMLKMHREYKIVKDIKSDFERAKEVDKKMDLTDWLDRKWLLGVKTFLSSTLSVIKTTLFPTDEDDSVTERKGSIKKKRRKSKYMRRKNAERSTEIRQPSESVFKHNWAMFGGLFFLEQKGVMKKTIVIGDKIVNSTPDLAYPLTPVPQEGRNLQNCTLLFVVEVKGKPINNLSSECLEDQLDSYVLGQVGSELIAETQSSALYPNSLGIVFMETTFIFIYLKMPKEHHKAGSPLKSRGNIHYTRPFEMLKAADRAEVSEFLYWLGCIQNRHGKELF
nr:uncharacterized protein LOC105321034 isoform X2 [Crassostrea gigas]